MRWLVILLMVALPVALIKAQEPGFTETFDDLALPGWLHSPGLTVVDGVLRFEPGNFAFHGGEWGHLTLTVRTRPFSEGERCPEPVEGACPELVEGLAVSFRASDAGAYSFSAAISWPCSAKRVVQSLN